MIKPWTNDGRELDAFYSVELVAGGFDLIVESRGGSDHGPNLSRNRDYAPALEQHLARMRERAMILTDLQVASARTTTMEEHERRVSLDAFPLPLPLTDVQSIEELRHSIGRASAAFGRTDGSDRGNRTKRMRLRLRWSEAAGMSAHQIERLLSRPVIVMPAELPTEDPEELSRRVGIALEQFRAAETRGRPAPPAGRKEVSRKTGQTARFMRDPNVLAWILYVANGKCEICRAPAPFQREGGEPYLEVHHVRPLAEGGPDTVDNAVACCPNCHRQLHHAADRSGLRISAIAAIARLRDYPVVTSTGIPGNIANARQQEHQA